MCDDVDSEKHRICSVNKDKMIAIKKTSSTTIAPVCVMHGNVSNCTISYSLSNSISHNKNHFHAFALALATIRRAHERMNERSSELVLHIGQPNYRQSNRCYFMVFNIFCEHRTEIEANKRTKPEQERERVRKGEREM